MNKYIIKRNRYRINFDEVSTLSELKKYAVVLGKDKNIDIKNPDDTLYLLKEGKNIEDNKISAPVYCTVEAYGRFKDELNKMAKENKKIIDLSQFDDTSSQEKPQGEGSGKEIPESNKELDAVYLRPRAGVSLEEAAAQLPDLRLFEQVTPRMVVEELKRSAPFALETGPNRKPKVVPNDAYPDQAALLRLLLEGLNSSDDEPERE